MPIRRITANEAVVRTAAVEIKTLAVSGKQVTLALFRQFPERALVDPDTAALAGVPWGWVNYHPDPWCKDAAPHIHVVWQSGDVLYRSCVEDRRPGSADNRDREAIEDARAHRTLAVQALALAGALAGDGAAELLGDGAEKPYPQQTQVKVRGWTLTLAHDTYGSVGSLIARALRLDPREREPQTRYAPDASGGWTNRPETPAEIAQRLLDQQRLTQQALTARLAEVAEQLLVAPEQDLDDWAAILRRASDEHMAAQALRDQRGTAWRQQYANLSALDQLYIAV